MTEHDPNEMNSSGRDANPDRREDGQGPDGIQPAHRPYGDAGNLYEIPRVRPDDPPMRNWWVDDEPQQDGSGSPQTG